MEACVSARVPAASGRVTCVNSKVLIFVSLSIVPVLPLISIFDGQNKSE